MQPHTFPRGNKRLAGDATELSRGCQCTDTSAMKALALAALEPLSAATIATSYEIPLSTPSGLIALSVSPEGDLLEKLGHTCFQHALEEALERYRHWLRCIAEGQPFPASEGRLEGCGR